MYPKYYTTNVFHYDNLNYFNKGTCLKQLRPRQILFSGDNNEAKASSCYNLYLIAIKFVKPVNF